VSIAALQFFGKILLGRVHPSSAITCVAPKQFNASSVDLRSILNRCLTTDQILISVQVMNAGILLLQKIV